MIRPAAHPATDEVWDELGGALTRNEDSNGWPLLVLLDAVGRLAGRIYDLTANSWAQLYDVDAAALEHLPWLAQLTGQRLPAGLTDTQQRDRIRNRPHWQVGTPDHIRAAVREHLAGGKTVLVLERTGAADPADDPWHFVIRVYAAEVSTSSAALAAAVESICPADLQFTIEELPGQTWGDLIANHATWADVIAAYPTWADVIEDIP